MLFIDSISSSLLGLTFLFFLKMGIFGLILGRILGQLTSISYSALTIRKEISLKVFFDFSLIVSMSKYAVGLSYRV